jgi:hypothetical protein
VISEDKGLLNRSQRVTIRRTFSLDVTQDDTFAGLVDSTVGWFVSRMIGPFLRTDLPTLEPILIAMVIVVVTVSSFALGSLGALVCKLLGQTKIAPA